MHCILTTASQIDVDMETREMISYVDGERVTGTYLLPRQIQGTTFVAACFIGSLYVPGDRLQILSPAQYNHYMMERVQT